MATTNLITNITKSGDYPISAVCSATNNCGLLSLMLPTQWTEQMLYELPTLNIKIFMSDGTQLVSFDVDMSTVNRDTLEQSEPYSIPIYNLPSDFTFSITPLFDKYALQSHNDQIDTGDFGAFTTSETGIVNTNIKDYSSLYWTTPTQTFNISIDFDDSNIVAGGGSGGGGGGGSITIDTQVNGTSTNAVQNKAIYNFVNSSVATNTANFIDTFNSVEELEAYTGTVTNNDYAFVIGTDSDGNTIYNRYKYNGSEWVFEYTLNNSSFTAAQWATIQSGLTASDKTKLDGIETGANKTVVDENLSATSTNPVQNKTVNTALAAKQDTIADLSTIRSGAAAGATAVQQTTFETDQARQDALDAELAEEIETNKNSISSLQDMQTNSMKLVYRHFFGPNSGTVSYKIVTSDFKAVDDAQQCGMYLITIINWSTTPNASIYIAYYSGGAAGYNALTKIGGADAQITIDENRYINYTGKGKIQIYALQ